VWLVLLLSTQGTFSQVSAPEKSAFQGSPAGEPTTQKNQENTAHKIVRPTDSRKSARKIAEKKAPELVRQADPQKSAPQSTAAADVTGIIPERKGHRLVLQVASNEPGIMNLALNNATNAAEHYRAAGEKIEIEIVVYGPGLHMLRDDTSPVKSRIASLSQSSPNISFMACNNTQQNMQKQEGKEIPLVPEAKIVKSGVVHVMELQEQGWTYVRP
jgi:intracellular sulfur oxidation DsrE/DsrF family protein